GVGCIGCTMPAFWDAMSPFTRRLPSPVPFFPNVTVDQVGTLAVGGIAGVAGLHAVGSFVRAKRQGAVRRRLARVAAVREAGAVADEPAMPLASDAPPPAEPLSANEAAVVTTSETSEPAPASEGPIDDERPADVTEPPSEGA
ncbi:MAG TPA: hypothetical protein VET90_02090, partial [Candidatus Binatus sp.]|nr:hypothetical protein [Candidatus Binatus sp.]